MLNNINKNVMFVGIKRKRSDDSEIEDNEISLTQSWFEIEENESPDHWNNTLKKSVQSGFLYNVLPALTRGADAGLVIKDGYTLLHDACARGYTEIARLLIDHKADVHAIDSSGKSPLHYAAIQGNRKTVVILIENGANIFLETNCLNRDTPLILAMKNNNIDVFSLLLYSGHDLNSANKGYLSTPLHLHEPWIKSAPIHSALFNASDELKKRFIEISHPGSYYIDSHYYTPLHFACLFKNNVKNIEALLNQNAILEARDPLEFTPLHWAVECGHIENVKFLIEKGANVNSQKCFGVTPLISAVINGDYEMIELLLEHHANINDKVCKLFGVLFYALSSNLNHESSILSCRNNKYYSKNIKILLKKGAEFNLENDHEYAFNYCDSETFKFLIDHDGRMSEILEYALSDDIILRPDIIQYLVENGADLEYCAQFGFTVFLSASVSKNIELMKYLLQRGADINARSMEGASALHFAIDEYNAIRGSNDSDTKQKLINIIEFLFSNEIDLGIKDSNGKTAYNLLEDNCPELRVLFNKAEQLKIEKKLDRLEDVSFLLHQIIELERLFS